MKNEPEDYSIDDLKRDKTEPWDGIRNYQVRNMIRDDMSLNDQAFFYHSNCDIPGIYGIMTINSNAYPDYTAFNKKAKYYDSLHFKRLHYLAKKDKNNFKVDYYETAFYNVKDEARIIKDRIYQNASKWCDLL